MEKIEEVIKEGNLDEYKAVANELLTEYQDAVTIVAAALKTITKEPDKTPVHITAVHITEERPLPSKRDSYRGGGGGGNRNRRGKSSSQSYKGNRKPQRRSGRR